MERLCLISQLTLYMFDYMHLLNHIKVFKHK